MKIDQQWKRIGGFHLEDSGDLGAVWLAQDAAKIYLYDAAIFRREVPAVIASGIAARGRHLPLAWRKKDQAFADQLLDAGINVLPEPSPDDPGIAELVSREIWEGLRAKRFFVDERVTEWREENKKFFIEGQRVPEGGFPLMAATRHALQMIDYAVAEYTPSSNKPNHPGIQVI